MTHVSLKKIKIAAPPAETNSAPSPAARPADHPDVWIFPPVLPLGGLALSFMLEWLFPWDGTPVWLPDFVRRALAAFFLVTGLALIVSSRTAMMRARTNVDPRRPALRLVQVFPFTRTRNPMYLGGNLACVGLALAWKLHWMLLIFPILISICHFGVVLREEDYLAQKFGPEYLNYKARVRRWF